MLIIGLRTEDADVSVVRLLKRPRIVVHVLQQVKNTQRRDLVRPTKTKTSVHTIRSYCFWFQPCLSLNNRYGDVQWQRHIYFPLQ